MGQGSDISEEGQQPNTFAVSAPEVSARDPTDMCSDWQILVWSQGLDIFLWDPWPSPAVLETRSPGNSHSSTGGLSRSQMPEEVLSTSGREVSSFPILVPQACCHMGQWRRTSLGIWGRVPRADAQAYPNQSDSGHFGGPDLSK